MIELPRRRFLAGLVGLIAAPAVVKATSLMPVKVWLEEESLKVGMTLSGTGIPAGTVIQELFYRTDDSFARYSGYSSLWLLRQCEERGAEPR